METEEAPRGGLGNAHLALLVFLVAEIMLFAALISSFLIFKSGEPSWPPADLPRLPLAVTVANTLGLSLSAVTMIAALSALKRGRQGPFRGFLGATAFLGVLFLAVQGTEWAGLVRQGLTLQAGMFGGIFYALVGLHAAHVAGAVVFLLEVLRRALNGRYGPRAVLGPSLCTVYWLFVVVLWIGLFVLVYLPWKPA